MYINIVWDDKRRVKTIPDDEQGTNTIQITLLLLLEEVERKYGSGDKAKRGGGTYTRKERIEKASKARL
jgi:hypothetical protein